MPVIESRKETMKSEDTVAAPDSSPRRHKVLTGRKGVLLPQHTVRDSKVSFILCVPDRSGVGAGFSVSPGIKSRTPNDGRIE